MSAETTTAATSVGSYHIRKSPLGKRGMRLARLLVSYTVLLIGACFMVFPLLWMLSASFKPEWQIFTRPPIWIPQEWIQVQAGQENSGINTYTVEHDGEEREVIRLGRRRFTSVIALTDVAEHMIVVPNDQLSGAQTQEVNGVPFNVRTWNSPDGRKDVVALSRADDGLAVIETDRIASAQVLPLTEVRGGDRDTQEINDIRFQGRVIEVDGQPLTVLELGPESELAVVSDTEVAQYAILTHKSNLGEQDNIAIGESALDVYTLQNDDSGVRYVVATEESWQPVLELDVVREHAFTVPNTELVGEEDVFLLPSIELPQVQVIGADGEPQDVVVVNSGSNEVVVLPLEYARDMRLGPVSKLTEDQASMRVAGGGILRIKEEFDEYGAEIDVALVGPPQEMALIIPEERISAAFDVDSANLERNTRVHLRIENFERALTAEIGGANFITFFQNSGIVVALNLLGHFLSCTIVAYAFARLRAPGKNIMFAILLSTMMLPFPVTLIPVYEIFRDLGMIDTLYPLWVRAFFGHAFFIFLLRQFFMTIPVELEEAARIDGANTFHILTRIIIPLSTPALATMAIFTFLWSWNDFFTPFVFINSPSNYTATVGLNLFKGHFTTNYEVLMAASVVVVTPTILLFFFLQRYFIEGIQLTGLKG